MRIDLILLVVVATYLGVAVGRWPGLRANRAAIALFGAAVLLALNAITMDQAFVALDMSTLTLLFSMMVLNANLRIAGFFGWVTAGVMGWARGPKSLLALVLLTSAGLSALFLNDTICLMLTPLVLEIALALKRDPRPYLVGVAVSANIGSVCTITGNPQNMLIGTASGIGYLDFWLHLAPISALGVLIAFGVLVLVYPAELRARMTWDPAPPAYNLRRPLFFKCLVAVTALLAMFLLGVPVAKASLLATAGLLISRRLEPARIFEDFDWQLLVFFSGLFIVTGAMQTSGWSDVIVRWLRDAFGEGLGRLGLLTAVLSNLVSNVPAVLLLRPLVGTLADPTRAWLMVACSSTLAGNLTLLGSVANLIVAEQARPRVELGFFYYLRAGVPITLLTLAVAWAWLLLMN